MITLLQIKQRAKKNRIVNYFLSKYYYEVSPIRKLSYGEENADKTFYVIGRDNNVGGAWALINTVMMHIGLCEENGYTPIVDMLNFKTQYTKEDEFGKINLWEKFFQQPAGYTLDDIKHSKNIIVSSTSPVPSAKYNSYAGSDIWSNSEKLTLFKDLFAKYIRFNDKSKNFLDCQAEKYLKGHKNVIGVLCRGTDFLINKPVGNDIQPDPEVVLADVKAEFSKGIYDAVFLATEDQDIQDLFVAEFGNLLLSVDQVRISKKEMKGDAWIASVRNKLNPQEDKDIAFLSYFTATYILSKCRCFFAGKNNGSKGVLYMPSNFDFVKIYELGRY